MPERDELTLNDAKRLALLWLNAYDETADYTTSAWKIGGECFREYLYDDQMSVLGYNDSWSISAIYYGNNRMNSFLTSDGGYYTYWLSIDAKTGNIIDFEKY